MKIQSIRLTNYRIHRELEAAFDPSLTLVGGPNESGKSTLADAAYNALFLRAKRGGAEREKLVSRHGGNPGIELRFERSGRSYTVRKCFRGPQGTIVLSEQGGPSWNADAAEEKLLELCGLRAEDVAGRAVPKQWEHLWARQGRAGEDPSPFATEKKSSLLARLQGVGAAAIFQSPLDSRIAGQIAAEVAEIHTARGPKAGSELDIATRAATAAAELRQSAGEACALLEQAVSDFDQSSRDLADAVRSLADLQSELSEVRQKLVRAAELGALLDRQRAEARHRAEELRGLSAGHELIRDARSRLDAEAGALAPREASLCQASGAEASARAAHANAEAAHAGATRRSHEARAGLDLARLCVKRFELAELAGGLKKRADDARSLRSRLAALPAVTMAHVNSLQRLDREREKLAGALAAISTRIEILAADFPVAADGKPLATGQLLEFSHDTEITIGSAIRMRITPGGGTSLAGTRRKLTEAEASFQRELAALGVSSLAGAEAANSTRDEILVRLEGSESIEQELAGAESRLDETSGDILRRSAAHGHFFPPPDAPAAATLLLASQEQNDLAALSEAEAAKSLSACFKNLESAIKAVASLRDGLQSAQKTLEGLKGQVTQLLATHGDDAVRASRLSQLSEAKYLADAALEATGNAFQSLQPRSLEADESRLNRAISNLHAAKISAGERLAVAKNSLRREGTNDPRADLALALASERAANERLATAKRHAAALALLHSLFSAEQQSLADQLTRPLANKVSGYLQCIFGPSAHASVAMTPEGVFEALTLSRPGSGTFSFSELSGGAQEQTAIAFRLAMAEILAEEHDGCLPVFLDDAFTNSDPSRVALLQRMLDLAASRGLQIIVLSCSPSDYAALGAHTVLLPATSSADEPHGAGRLVPAPSEAGCIETDQSRSAR